MARFSARAFISRIAERDGVSLEEARRRVTAFFAILREELPSSQVERLEEELAAGVRQSSPPAPSRSLSGGGAAG